MREEQNKREREEQKNREREEQKKGEREKKERKRGGERGWRRREKEIEENKNQRAKKRRKKQPSEPVSMSQCFDGCRIGPMSLLYSKEFIEVTNAQCACAIFTTLPYRTAYTLCCCIQFDDSSY